MSSRRHTHLEPHFQTQILCRQHYKWSKIHTKLASEIISTDPQKSAQHTNSADVYLQKALKRARRLVPIQHRSDDKYVFSYCEHLLLVSDHIIYPSAPKPLTEEVYWEATIDPNTELCTALTIKSNYN